MNVIGVFWSFLNVFSTLLLLFELSVSHNVDELEKHRNLESFVELKGGDFFMGINDRKGVNGEHPMRKGIVSPFRCIYKINNQILKLLLEF